MDMNQFNTVADELVPRLYKNAFTYLKFLGCDEPEEIISRAYLKLLEHMHSYESESHILKAWKSIVVQSQCDDYRQHHKMLVEVADSSSSEAKELDSALDARKIITKAFTFLNDRDIEILVAFHKNNCNAASTAKAVGLQREVFYYHLKKIRVKINHLVDNEERHSNARPQPYGYKIGAWSRFLQCVEVCDYAEWSPAFYDPKGADRAEEGIIPNTLPTVRRLFESIYHVVKDDYIPMRLKMPERQKTEKPVPTMGLDEDTQAWVLRK